MWENGEFKMFWQMGCHRGWKMQVRFLHLEIGHRVSPGVRTSEKCQKFLSSSAPTCWSDFCHLWIPFWLDETFYDSPLNQGSSRGGEVDSRLPPLPLKTSPSLKKESHLEAASRWDGAASHGLCRKSLMTGRLLNSLPEILGWAASVRTGLVI